MAVKLPSAVAVIAAFFHPDVTPFIMKSKELGPGDAVKIKTAKI